MSQTSLALSLLLLAAPFLALLAYVVHLSRHKKSSRRPLGLVGRVGSVARALGPEGFVLVEGELWRARLRDTGATVGADSKVRVVGASGCVIEVEPLG